MTDLTDLDRRAAVVMGLPMGASHGRGWLYGRVFAPTLDANDCREFERFALSHGADRVLTNFDSTSATATVRVPCPLVYYHRHTSLEPHGPTYDLVAVVLALLAALEAKS